MKLEHLIQALNLAGIQATIDKDKEMTDGENKAGVIKFSNDIYASYMLDEEEMIIAFNLYINGIVQEKRNAVNQFNHITKSIIIMQKLIELIGNLKQEEANVVLNKLGMFSGKKIKEKAVEMLNYIYKINTIDGVLVLLIFEKEKDSPPIKSEE